MNGRLSLTQVQTIGDELAMAWSDGTEAFFRLEDLRRACPCAACGGEPDILGNVDRPEVKYTERSFEMVRLGFVGGYAVQPLWGDGHGSGIYSFSFLQRLGAELG
jgi:DUF971 family protein